MDQIVYDYSKLKGKVREVFYNNKNYAKFLNISEGSLYDKYNSKSFFTQNQIIKSMEIFEEDLENIGIYFFTKKVEKN